MNYGKNTTYKSPIQDRINLARDTMQKIQEGSYYNSEGKVVSLTNKTRDAINSAVYYAESDISSIIGEGIECPNHETEIEVVNETTMQAAQTLVQEKPNELTLALNFASAKHPGGGFLHGAQAQEECLARSSNLYQTLTTEETEKFYVDNKAVKTSLYTHGMILSPKVTFFKDDGGNVLDEPYQVDVITCAAVNAGAVATNEHDRLKEINPTMDQRIDYLLGVAAYNGYTNLILGAWGCGVFGNDPEVIAGIFKQKLEGVAKGYFKKVKFSILDTSEEKIFIGPFEKVFLNCK